MSTRVHKRRRSALERRKGTDRRARKVTVPEDRRSGERRVLLRRLQDILRQR